MRFHTSLQAVLPSRTAYPKRQARYPRILSGAGPYLTGEDGTTFLDASSGSGSLIFGHGDEELVEVMTAQARRLTVFPSRGLGVEIVERYLQEWVDFAPPGFDCALTCSSGSDAVEASIKLALQFHRLAGRSGRTKIIGRRGSYHGNTLSALAAGGFEARREPFSASLPAVAKASSAYCERCEFGKAPRSCELECARSFEEAILSEDPDTVAAVIVEPVVGAALSAAVPDSRYLERVRAICKRHHILLILDEVMTGFGRTGRRFGADLWNVTADILVAGKAMSAGYFPLSGVLVSRELGDAFAGPHGPFQNGHTHACSPVGAAVGRIVIERLHQGPFIENARVMGLSLREELRAQVPGEIISNVRGEGLMIGFDITPTAARAGAAESLQQAALRRGLILYASGGGPGTRSGDHAMLLPPLTIGPRELQLIVSALTGAARDLLSSESLA